MSLDVIAELGSNHEGSLERTLRLVEGVVRAGATHVKFQYFDPRRTWDDALLRWRGRLATLPASWVPSLARFCRSLGVAFGLSVFDPQDVPFAAEHGDFLKIAHWKSDVPQLVEAAASTGLPLYVSLPPGRVPSMAGDRATLLFCLPHYPTPSRGGGFHQLRNFLVQGGRRGFSDHTRSLLTGALGYVWGARAFEKHVRLADTYHSPDAPVSVTVEEFRRYVQLIQEAVDLCTP